MSLGRSTHVVDFAPVFFICRSASDTCEASENLLSEAVDGIGRGFLDDLAAARSDAKTEGILYRCQIGAFTPSRRQCCLHRGSAAFAEAGLFAFLSVHLVWGASAS